MAEIVPRTNAPEHPPEDRVKKELANTRRGPSPAFTLTRRPSPKTPIRRVSVKPELTRAYVCQSLNRVYPGRGFGRPPPARRAGAFCDAGGASPAGPIRPMSILVKHRAGKVSVKPRLARTHALPAPSRAPPAGRPARPPPDGSGASEAPGRSARGGADRAHINLGLTAEGDPLSTKSRLRTIFLLPAGAFSEKRQVAKFDLIEKSFLTVILCYRIDAFVPSLRWRKLALAGS